MTTYRLPLRARPSVAGGFATRINSARPNLWKQQAVAWSPCLGPTGLVLVDRGQCKLNGTLVGMDTDVDWMFDGGGYYLDFDGSNDRITVPDHPVLGFGLLDFCISFWIKTTHSSGTKNILDKGFASGSASRYAVQITASGTILFYLGGATRTGTIAVNDGEWHHVLLNRRESFSESFVDGDVDLADAEHNDPNPTLSNTDQLTLMCRSDETSFLAGSLDDIRIYRRELVDHEAWTLSGFGGNHRAGRTIAYQRKDRLILQPPAPVPSDYWTEVIHIGGIDPGHRPQVGGARSTVIAGG